MAYTRKSKVSDSALIPDAIDGTGKWTKQITSDIDTKDSVVSVTKKDKKVFVLNSSLYDTIHEDAVPTLEKIRRRAFSRVRWGARRDTYTGNLSASSAQVLEEIRVSTLERRKFGEEESFTPTPEIVLYGANALSEQGKAYFDALEDKVPKIIPSVIENDISRSFLYLMTADDSRDMMTRAEKVVIREDGDYSTRGQGWKNWSTNIRPKLDEIVKKIKDNPTQKTVVEVGQELDALLKLSKNNKKQRQGQGQASGKKEDRGKVVPFINNYFRAGYSYKQEELGYVPGSYGTKWAPIEWTEPELTVKCVPPKSKTLSKQPRRKVSDMGNAPNRIERLMIDQRIFSPKLRKKTPTPVTLVVDCSGSMSPDFTALTTLIEKAPNTQVVFYSGHADRNRNPPGKVFFAAKNGMRIEDYEARRQFRQHGANDCDLNVLKWATTQPGRVVWISDGQSYSLPTDREPGYRGITECAAFIKHYDIPRYYSITEYVAMEFDGK